MSVTLARLETMPWEKGAHDLERKKAVPGHGVVLLELASGFADPNWCERSHVLYVIEGAIELELDDGATVVGAGQCAVVDRGTRHRARNPGVKRAVAFIVSDVEAPK